MSIRLMIGRVGDQPPHLVAVSQVGDEPAGATSELGGSIVDALARQRDRDRGALARERSRRGGSDAGGIAAPGDERGSALEFVDHGRVRASAMASSSMAVSPGA